MKDGLDSLREGIVLMKASLSEKLRGLDLHILDIMVLKGWSEKSGF